MTDLLITNARIHTLDPERPRAAALLARDGRIVAVDDDIPYAPDVPTYDLGGRTVVPGFVDSHVHFVWTGVQHFALPLAELKTVAAVQERVRAAVEHTSADQLILGLGLDDETFGAGLPTAAELDAVAPDHAVLLKGQTGHLTVANAAAMRRFGLGPDVDGWSSSGRMVGAANTVTAWRAPTEFAAAVGWRAVFGAAAAEAASVGITTLHALEGDDAPDDAGVRALLALGPELPVRTVLYWQTTHVAAAQALGLPRIGGCIWVDGDFAPHTAALKQPYHDYAGSGALYLSDDRLGRFVEAANAAGMQIALHCVGDAAVQQVLRAYGRALERHPRADHRHRVEHFELYDADLLHDARRLGVSVAIQPAFDGAFGGYEYSARLLGPERAHRADAIATFDRAGIPIGAGSDSTVTPLGPIMGIHYAVNHSNPRERVSAERALRLWTVDSARLAFEEDHKGTLAVGKLADFVVLDQDVLAVPADQIKDIAVEMTVMGGRVTYAAGEPQGLSA